MEEHCAKSLRETLNSGTFLQICENDCVAHSCKAQFEDIVKAASAEEAEAISSESKDGLNDEKENDEDENYEEEDELERKDQDHDEDEDDQDDNEMREEPKDKSFIRFRIIKWRRSISRISILE